METLTALIQPRSAFGGAIWGDTLFGQLCWAALHRWGEQRLHELLDGYTEGNPFLVVSDAFPSGYVPRPALPLHRFGNVPDADRKQVKKLIWLPRKHFNQPLNDWLKYAESDNQITEHKMIEARNQSHNTINRMTGTTGAGEFAPYSMPQQWFATELKLDLYITCDQDRLDVESLTLLLKDVGMTGYGRDASIGLGKYDVLSLETGHWPAHDNANAWLTLAPSAPQGQKWDSEKSWYQPFTRFGRHGDMAVHFGKPFKTPLLMADTAALLTPAQFATASFVGQGLGGDGSLSKAIPQTVHQGYAPALPVHVGEAS
ncbi:MAG: CRISPR-associated protein Csm7 [Granulosicoccus sp.]